MIGTAFIGLASVHVFLVLAALGTVVPAILAIGLGGVVFAAFMCQGPSINTDTWTSATRHAGWSERTASFSWKVFQIGMGLLVIPAMAWLIEG